MLELHYYDYQTKEPLNNKEIEPAKMGFDDYCVQGGFFGAAEIEGKRTGQEDRIAYFALNQAQAMALRALDNDARERLLHQVYEGLNADIADSRLKDGSTGISVLFDPSKGVCHFANLGDSELIEIKLNKKTGKLVSVKRLNDLHNANEPAEVKRLIAEGHKPVKLPKDPTHFRLGSGLAVSRAFGDINHIPFGLSHDPQVKSHPIDQRPNIETFYVVACDGLLEADCLTYQQIGNLISSHRQYSLADLARLLIHKAYFKADGSHDNISVQVCRFPSDKNRAPFMLGVYDGHGGAQTSQFLADNVQYQFSSKLQPSVKVSPAVPSKKVEKSNRTPRRAKSPNRNTVSTNTSAELPSAKVREIGYSCRRMDENTNPTSNLLGWSALTGIATGIFASAYYGISTAAASSVASAAAMGVGYFESQRQAYQMEALKRFLTIHANGKFHYNQEMKDFMLGFNSKDSYVHWASANVRPGMWFFNERSDAYHAGMMAAKNPDQAILKPFKDRCRLK